MLFLAVALSVTGVERVEVQPTEFQLHQNYPNPFNPSTEIQFDLKEEGQVHLTVHDMAGRVTDLLVDGVQMMTGRYRLRWDAADRASGVYLLRLIVSRRNGHAPFVATRKLVLLR